jgi:hypothetical protein
MAKEAESFVKNIIIVMIQRPKHRRGLIVTAAIVGNAIVGINCVSAPPLNTSE